MGIALILPECDFSDKSLGKVTIKGNVPLTGISIVGDDNVNGVETQYTCMYSPAVTTERDVVWSVESGNQYAYINPSTGLLLVLEGASNANVTIKAVSALHPDIYATKNIVVTYNASEALVLREGLALVSDGTAYLNAAQYFTGAKRWNNVAMTIDIKFKAFEQDTEARSVFGFAQNIAHGMGQACAICLTTGLRIDFGGYPSTDVFSDSASFIGSEYRFVADHKNISLYKNNALVDTLVSNEFETTITTDIFPVFARLYKNGTASTPWELIQIADNVGIYSFKLTTDAGGDVCDLVPCLYNNVPAMYDRISEQVLTTVDGGSFTLRQ